MREIEFKISEKDSKKEIRDFLRQFGVSASLLKKLKNTENGITVNGSFARAIDILNTGDILKIAVKSSGEMPTKLDDKRVSLVFSDKDILVLNKPPFMPVHESRNHRGDTLANAAAYYMNENTSFRAVYRLDRDTSGLVLIAKNELAAAKLAGKIKKDYYAVVGGLLEGEGTIDLPIRREKESIIKRGVFSDGERAVTHWEAVKTDGKNTLLKINLETGRTHQIRVHFSYLGAPLLGDSLYGGDCSLINRQALHCKKISFIHPISGERISLECDFPEDFKGLI